MGEERRGAYRVLVGNSERKRPGGRRMCRWEGSIKMDLQLVGWGGGMDRIDLARDRELLKCEMVGIRNSLAPWFGKITLRSVLPAEISSHVLLSADQNILFTFYRYELQNDLYTSSAFGR